LRNMERVNLLFLICNRPGISIWGLLRLQWATFESFFEAFNQLVKDGLVTVDSGDKVSITEKGKALLDSEVGDSEHFDFECSDCEGKGFQPSPEFLHLFSAILKDRPPPEAALNQKALVDSDVLLKLGFFLERGDLYQKDVLIIGDYEGLSILAALTRLPKKVVVLEQDERLVDFINGTAVANDLTDILTAEKYEVDKGIPETYHNSFDTFSFSNAQNFEQVKQTVSGGVSALKGVGCAFYLELSMLEVPLQTMHDMQGMLLELDFVTTDCRKGFGAYTNSSVEQEKQAIHEEIGTQPDCEWFSKSLMRCEWV